MKIAKTFIDHALAIHAGFLAALPPCFVPDPVSAKPKYSPRAEKLAALCKMDWGAGHGAKIRTLCELITGEPIPDPFAPTPRSKKNAAFEGDREYKLAPQFSFFVVVGNSNSHNYKDGETIMRSRLNASPDVFLRADGDHGNHLAYTQDVRPATVEEAKAFLSELVKHDVDESNARRTVREYKSYADIYHASIDSFETLFGRKLEAV